MAGKKYNTPLLDELEKGPWPSFVTEMKKAGKKSEMANDAVGHLEMLQHKNGILETWWHRWGSWLWWRSYRKIF